MKSGRRSSNNVDEIRRYLLGQLGEGDRTAMEERLFLEAGGLEQVEAVEDELIDAYLAGELRGAEKRAWEAYREARPEVARREVFAGALRERFRRESPGFRWQWVAAFAVLVMGLFWGMRPEQIVHQDVRLTAGTLRGAEGPQVVRVGAGVTELLVDFGNSEAVRVRVRGVDSGREAWAGAVERGGAKMPVFAAGDYVATVMDRAGEELADYSFRVER